MQIGKTILSEACLNKQERAETDGGLKNECSTIGRNRT